MGIYPSQVGTFLQSRLRGYFLAAAILGSGLSNLFLSPVAEAQTNEPVLETVAHISGFTGSNIQLQRAAERVAIGLGTPLFAGDKIFVGDGAQLTLDYGRLHQPRTVRSGERIYVDGKPPDPALRQFLSRISSPLRDLFAPSSLISILNRSGRGGEDLELPQGSLRPSPLLPPGKYVVTATTEKLAVVWRGNADRLNLEWGGDQLRVLGSQGTYALVALPSGIPTVRITARQGPVERLSWEVDRTHPLPASYPTERQSDAADLIFALELLGLLDRPTLDSATWRLEGLSRLAQLSTHFYPAEVIFRALRLDRLKLQ
jgi:hypothetical protein